MSTQELKARSLYSLKNNWLMAIVASLIYSFGISFSIGPISFGSGMSSSSSTALLSGDAPPELLIITSIIAIVCSLVGIVLTLALSPLYYGYIEYHMQLAYGQKADLSVLFGQFRNFLKCVSLYFLKGLFIYLWSLLLFVPGIIKYYSYAMADFLIVQNPNLKATEAINLSKQMMDGHKMDLFILELSFIGWGLLNLLVCGLGSVVLTPYIMQARTHFFLELSSRPRY